MDPTVVSVVTSVFALVVSAAAAIYQKRAADVAKRSQEDFPLSHSDSQSSQRIDDAFDAFFTLNQIQIEHPLISHVLVAAKDYQLTSGLVREATAEFDRETVAELRLQERAAAMYVFGVFEHSVFQRKAAITSGATARIEFLEAVLNHLSLKLLRNRRLLHLWAPGGGDLCQYYEDETQDYYREKVLTARDGETLEEPDGTGPYPG